MSCGVGEYMLLECIECPRSIRLNLPHYMTDAEAAPHFYKKGWSIKPTLCPECLRQRVDNE